MTNQTDHGLSDMLRKVQALIAQADSTTFPEEAATFRAKAEALMLRYRIEESMLADAAPVGAKLVPIWAAWRVCQFRNHLRQFYQEIASWCLLHVGARGIFRTAHGDDGKAWMELHCVGYESDLRYGEMLLTSALLAFGQNLEPDVDPLASDQVNAYILRKAGMGGREVAIKLWGEYKRGRAAKVIRLYKAEAEARGEDPSELSGQGNNMDTYRNSYANGFSMEIYSRLNRMRITQGEASHALVLSGRKDAVDEAFYKEHSYLRPGPAVEDGRKNCSKCLRNKSGHCRDHPAPSYGGGTSKTLNYRAYRRGQGSASTVDLGGTGRLT